MSDLYEKMKNIKRRVHKADAVVRSLEEARKNYSQGRYSSCAEDVFRVKKLDPEHPEADTLKNHCQRRKKGKIPDDEVEEELRPENRDKTEPFPVNMEGRLWPIDPHEKITTVDFEDTKKPGYKIPSDDHVNWIISGIVGLMIAALVYYIITGFVIPAFTWTGDIIGAGLENIWLALKAVGEFIRGIWE